MTSLTESSISKRLTLLQHLSLASYWFAFNALWGSLLFIVVAKHAEIMEGQGRLWLFGQPLGKAAAEGITLGIGALLAAVVPPVVGAISDRCCSQFGRRRPFVFGGTAILVTGLWWLWVAFKAGDFTGYILAFLLVQLGANIGAGAYSGIIPDIVPPGQRGIASGWMAAMAQLGTISGAFTAGILAAQGRYGLLTLFISALVVLFAGITVIGVRESPISKAAPLRARDLLLSFWVNPIRYPDFGWLWLSRAAVTFGVYLIQPFLLYYLADVVRVGDLNPPLKPEAVMPYWMVAALVAATPMGLIGARISDRIGRRIVVCVSTLVMAGGALSFVLIGGLPSPEMRVVAAVALGVVWGLGYGSFGSVDWALGTEVLPNPEDAAKDMGVWHLSMTVPQSAAPPVAGALVLSRYQIAGQGGASGYQPLGYVILFGLAALFLAIGAVLVFRIKKVK